MAPDGATVLHLTGLGVNGTLDLADNYMILDTFGGTLAQVQALLTSGYAGGAWNGLGINSSAAAADSSLLTGLGFAAATDLFTTFPATFAGQSVSNNAVLVRYTYYGDHNLNGTVDSVDFNLLAANFSGSPRRWSQGDSNYDTTVDTTDFNLLASNFGKVIAAPPPAARAALAFDSGSNSPAAPAGAATSLFGDTTIAHDDWLNI